MRIKDLHNRITAEIVGGKQPTELFQELSAQSPGNEAKIAYAIGCVPAEEKRKKYLKINGVLTLLLVLNSIFCLLAELPINLDEPTLFIALKTVLPLIFCYFTFRFFGAAYRFIAIWSLIDFLETAILSLATPPNPFVAYKMLIVFLVMTLCWYIAIKVFPNIGVMGPKKGPDGKYIL